LVDITPNARVLLMLGEVAIEPWQCIAELIDNSIDGYLRNPNYNDEVMKIEIHLPSEEDLDNGVGEIIVRDYALGMDEEVVADSVRAGLSGNDGYERLGLFGMGFNIATAKLGTKTKIQSSKINDDQIYWLEINPYALLEHSKINPNQKFEAPDGYLPKKEIGSGTSVTISDLKADIVRDLITYKSNHQNVLRRKLGRIYSPLMESYNIDIRIFSKSSTENGHPIVKWGHCIWGAEHNTNYKEVDDARRVQLSAFMDVKIPLPSQYYCNICWNWYDKELETTSKCIRCNSSGSISQRKRVITGWIGVQRAFFSGSSRNFTNHYGIDLVRNGRVIEILSKDFFTVAETDGGIRPDYPVEGNQGGRIVGSLDISFAPCDFRKSIFTRGDINWKLIMKKIQGNGLRPDVTKKDGKIFIVTPLTKMVRGWGSAKLGKNKSPGSLTLIEGELSKERNGKPILDQNGLPKLVGNFSNHRSLCEKFWTSEDPSFKSEIKWMKGIDFADDFDPYDYLDDEEEETKQFCLHGNIVGECDECKEKGSQDTFCIHGNPSSKCGECNQEFCKHGSITKDCFICHPENNPDLEIDSDLSRTYNLESELSYAIDVKVFKDLSRKIPENGILITKNNRKSYTVIYKPEHSMFSNFKEGPSDYVLMEISKTFTQFNKNASISTIYLMLKEKYHLGEKIDLDSVRRRAKMLLDIVKDHFVKLSIPWHRNSSDAINSEVMRSLQKEHKGKDSLESELRSGEFIFRLTDEIFFEEIVQQRIPSMLDGNLFSSQHGRMGNKGQERVTNEYITALRIICEISTRTDLAYEDLFLTDLYIKKLNNWLV